MSYWTYISGTVTVSVPGRTQAEKKYVLDTVLAHLPLVTGSEGEMDVYTIQKNGHNVSSPFDEFGYETDNLVDRYGCKNRHGGWLLTQDEYIIVLDASLRDKMFDETLHEFNKWICRLSKRLYVNSIVVKIGGQNKDITINNDDIFRQMYNFGEEGVKNWCDYLLWWKNSLKGG